MKYPVGKYGRKSQPTWTANNEYNKNDEVNEQRTGKS